MHQQVKTKILERMEEWAKMFDKNPELGIMGMAYGRLKSQNPNIQPPQAPGKRQITDYDRRKEDEELQLALKLSIQDKGRTAASEELSATPTQPQASQTASTQSAPTLSQGTTAATVSRVRALFDFVPSEEGELQFRKGDVIAVIESAFKDWWKGSLRGQVGIFPLNYVEKLQDPTGDDLRREAEMEAEVFGQIKNVERLLALLSTSNGDVGVKENEEITRLYHDTVAIRPKLIELIGKYTQRKGKTRHSLRCNCGETDHALDDLQQLNEKFIKARRDYESMLETSMAHSAAQYGRPAPMGFAPAGPQYGAVPPPQQYGQPQRYYTQDGGPPNGAIPYPPPGSQGMPPPGPSGAPYQPPYPISSPPPQSHGALPAHAAPQYAQQTPYPPSTQPLHQQQQPQRQASQSSQYGGAPPGPQEVPSYDPSQQPSAYPQPPQQQQQQGLIPAQTTGGSQYTASPYPPPDGPRHDDRETYAPQQPYTTNLPPQGGLPDGYPGGIAPSQSQVYQAYQPTQPSQPPPQPQTAYAGGNSNPSNFYR